MLHIVVSGIGVDAANYSSSWFNLVTWFRAHGLIPSRTFKFAARDRVQIALMISAEGK